MEIESRMIGIAGYAFLRRAGLLSFQFHHLSSAASWRELDA